MSGDVGVKFLEATSSFGNVVNSYTKARGAKTAAMYDAAVADAEASDARNRGATASARELAKTSRRVSSVKAQVAGRGFTVGVGTAADAETGTDLIGQLDALTIRENARREVLGARLRGTGARLRASSISPGGEALGTLIGEAAKTHRRWSGE